MLEPRAEWKSINFIRSLLLLQYIFTTVSLIWEVLLKMENDFYELCRQREKSDRNASSEFEK